MKMKKILIALAVMSIISFEAFAEPHGCPGGGGCCPRPPCPPPAPCRPCPPPPCPYRPYYPGCCDYRGSSGVRMAADIVSLVGASLDILRGPVVVTQPVAVPAVCPTYYNNGYVPAVYYR